MLDYFLLRSFVKVQPSRISKRSNSCEHCSIGRRLNLIKNVGKVLQVYDNKQRRGEKKNLQGEKYLQVWQQFNFFSCTHTLYKMELFQVRLSCQGQISAVILNAFSSSRPPSKLTDSLFHHNDDTSRNWTRLCVMTAVNCFDKINPKKLSLIYRLAFSQLCRGRLPV